MSDDTFAFEDKEVFRALIELYSLCSQRVVDVIAEQEAIKEPSLLSDTETEQEQIQARLYIAHVNKENAAIRLADFILSKKDVFLVVPYMIHHYQRFGGLSNEEEEIGNA